MLNTCIVSLNVSKGFTDESYGATALKCSSYPVLTCICLYYNRLRSVVVCKGSTALSRVWQIQALRPQKAAFVEGFQSHLASCSHRNTVLAERPGMKDFGGIQLHALGSENCGIEDNLRLPDVALSTVEDDAMFLGSLHQVQEVPVMLLGGTTKDTYIIINGNNAG